MYCSVTQCNKSERFHRGYRKNEKLSKRTGTIQGSWVRVRTIQYGTASYFVAFFDSQSFFVTTKKIKNTGDLLGNGDHEFFWNICCSLKLRSNSIYHRLKLEIFYPQTQAIDVFFLIFFLFKRSWISYNTSINPIILRLLYMQDHRLIWSQKYTYISRLDYRALYYHNYCTVPNYQLPTN